MIKLNRFDKAKKAVQKLLGERDTLTNNTALLLNSFDGSPVKSLPDAVLEIKDISKLPKLIQILDSFNIPFVPRAAGTNHDGGAVAIKGGVILNLNHLDEIEQINTEEKYARVQCGTVNGNLQKALDKLGFFYAPDPASKEFSTVGGNASLGAGGPKTLKYGATSANLLKAEFILPDGETLLLDKAAPGPDLLGLLVRSEGTLGLASRLWVKIKPKNPYKKTILAFFPDLQSTMLCVKDIISAGIIPSALEAMDFHTLKAAKTDVEAGALLIIELDGKKSELAAQAEKVLKFCSERKALGAKSADNEEQAKALWQSRLAAAAALASLGTGLISLDCAVSRSDLPRIITEISAIFAKYGLKAGIVFHAGDGNLHPNIAFNENNLYELSKIKKAVKEIHAAVCLCAGTISAEHGIGVEKRAVMAMMFDAGTLNCFRKIKQALDPKNLANPDKVLPIASVSQKILTPPERIKYLIETVKKANAEKTVLNLCGLNTKIKLKGKNNLSLKNLNKIIEVDKTNYTLTAEPGINVKHLAEELEKENLFLPFAPGKGSLGGDFCSKTAAQLKDYVTALDVILPDGTFIQYGGKYVKNTAGYDLAALFSGSRGAYGIVTSLTIRLLPFKPKTAKPAAFAPWRPNAVERKLKFALDANNILNPFYFEEAPHEN